MSTRAFPVRCEEQKRAKRKQQQTTSGCRSWLTNSVLKFPNKLSSALSLQERQVTYTHYPLYTVSGLVSFIKIMSLLQCCFQLSYPLLRILFTLIKLCLNSSNLAKKERRITKELIYSKTGQKVLGNETSFLKSGA